MGSQLNSGTAPKLPLGAPPSDPPSPHGASPCSPLSPPLSPASSCADLASLHHVSRLSLRHGARPEDIADYVMRLGAALRGALISGAPLAKGGCASVPGTVSLAECYRLGKELGSGHSGTVYTCQDIVTRETFACKSICKASLQREEDVAELCSEVLTMLRLHAWKHRQGEDSLVHLHEVIDEPCYVHIILDYCPGGDLFQYVSDNGRLSERDSAHVIHQLTSALQHLHSLSLVHRDVKPENVFLTAPNQSARSNVQVKLGDYGLCVAVLGGQQIQGAAGSPYYISPEVVAGRLYSGEVDVWSLGVVLYTLLAGYLPFWRESREDLYEAILRGRVNMRKHPWQTVSAGAKDLVKGMLNPDPVRRMWLQDVMDHPWMWRHRGSIT